MTPAMLFGLVFGPVAFAAVLALTGDMIGTRNAGRVGTSMLLLAAGATSLVGGVPIKPKFVLGAFMVGGGYSTITGAILILAALSLLSASDREGSAPALVALSAGGAALAASSADLVALLIALEIAAMCGYALVSGGRTTRSDEAAMKYFVQGAVATGLFVLGLAVLVGVTAGTANTGAIARAFGLLGAASPALLGTMALVTALTFKAGAAPFHSWAPDAYENAPAPAAGFLAGPVKLGMIVALTVFAAAMFPAGQTQARPLGLLGSELLVALGLLAIVSIVVGSTVALRTSSYRRMLGYAGVAQVGYALVALAAMQPTLVALFATTYAVGTSGAFIAAEVFRRRRPEWDGTIAGLAGLARLEPVTAASLTILLMSLAGIPPLIGFWGKLQAFGAAIGRAAQLMGGDLRGIGVWLGLLAVAGIVGSIVSLGYYGSVIRALYFDSAQTEAVEEAEAGEARAGEEEADDDAEEPGVARWVVVFLALASIALGVLPFVIGVSTTVRGFLLG